MDIPGAQEWLRFLLKAALGSGLFTLILWCAQSRNPRAAGIMLTFPAINGIGLLTAETNNLFLMAQAMPPMIALNGIFCAVYIIVQRRLVTQDSRVPPVACNLTLLGICLLLWGAVAFWVAPGLQTSLHSSRQMLTFAGVYAGCSVPITVALLWCPITPHEPVRLSFRQVLRANTRRVSGVFVFIMLVMLLARQGADAWAGRLSTLPLLPFYSLLVLSSGLSGRPQARSRLDQVGSTVLAGPPVAITFAWAYAHYLQALRSAGSTVATTIWAVMGLLGFWGLCGLSIWGILRLARALESQAHSRAVSREQR